MVSCEKVRELMSDQESDRVERTVTSLKKGVDKFSQAICAFANDLPGSGLPGYLLIGVQKDGGLSGLAVTEDFLETLGGLRSDGNIQPLPALAVWKCSFPEGDVAVIEVRPSDLPPVRYKGQVWIRVGPRRAVASEHEERLLTERRVAKARSFDARPCAESSPDDLALGLFEAYRREAVNSEVIAANHRPIEEQLASLRFFDLRSKAPTHAGILLFGINPRFFLPGAYIQYLRFPGPELDDLPDDQAEISGDLYSVLRELELRLKSGIHAAMETVSPLRERIRPDYPEKAVRETLMNAVMHRDYESNAPIRFSWFNDRIEIISPGGLYGEVTPENFRRVNGYRNPVIAEAMKTLGYVNRFGYGIRMAEALLAENGNPPLAFEFDPGAVLVTIHRRAA